MYQHWEKQRVRERTSQLLDEQLFIDLYPTLQEVTMEFDEPSPAELWDEAKSRWQTLLTSKRPEMAVDFLKEELTDIYGERGAFLVMMILMYMLVAMYRPKDENSPYRPYCQAIAEATNNNPLLKRFWEGVRMSEDEEEKKGNYIGVVCSLIADTKVKDQSFSLDTVEKCIMRLPTFEAQHEALMLANNLLMGTEWSARSGMVFDKMLAKEKEREQRRKEEMTINTQTVEVKGDAHVDYVEKMTKIPHVNTYNGYVKEQNNQYPQPIIGGNETKRIEE